MWACVVAWKIADSRSLRGFLEYKLDEKTVDHSTLSKTRKRLSLAVHVEVFRFVLTTHLHALYM